MNKIKSRRVKRARRRGKHTTRKGYRKYRKHHTRKFGKRMRRQTRTRRKDGGAHDLGPFNFVLPFESGIKIKGQGWAYVTKLGSLFSQTERPEQIIIFQKGGNENYFIARCTFSQCDITNNMEKEVLEVNNEGFKPVIKVVITHRIYDIITTSGKKYRIQPAAHDQNDPDGKNLMLFFSNLAAAEANANALAIASANIQKNAAAEAQKAKILAIQEKGASDLAAFKLKSAAADAKAAAGAQREYYFEDSEKAKINFKTQLSDAVSKIPEVLQKVKVSDLTIDDIKFMLKKIEKYSKDKQRCLLLCDPDSCDTNMLEKIKEKFIKNAPDNDIDLSEINLETDYIALNDILDDSLLLILENLCEQHKKVNESNIFTTLIQSCSPRILQLFKDDDKLHSILKIFFMSIVYNFRTPETLTKCVQNMEKLLALLNSITPQNMEKLLDLLNYMTPQNMEKLLDLLNSMTPESILKLLTYLATLNQEQIRGMLDTYNELSKNPESMARLLELYSFIEKSQNGEVLIHRYKGETPLVQSGILRNKKHSPATCDAVTALHNQVMKNGRLTIQEDEEFKKVLKECNTYLPSTSPEVVTGGGRKRRTLKNKRGGNSKR